MPPKKRGSLSSTKNQKQNKAAAKAAGKAKAVADAEAEAGAEAAAVTTAAAEAKAEAKAASAEVPLAKKDAKGINIVNKCITHTPTFMHCLHTRPHSCTFARF